VAIPRANLASKATVTPAPAVQPPAAAAGAPAAAGILQRGQAAFDRGDYPEALRRGREAIAAGGALGGHLLAGDAYYRLERFPDAIREYQAALALDPGSASIKRRRDLAAKGAQQ
jgi:tetratricopeptide (TPR) repeat protein